MRRHVTRARALLVVAALAPVALAPIAVVGSIAGAPAASAAAGDPSMPVAGDLSTAAVNTSTIAIPVPAGVTPTAITAVVTQSEVVTGGSIVFSVNGAPTTSVASSLYQKVRIPVTTANVTADGIISLSVAAQGAPVTGLTCVPTSPTPAAVRKVALEYTGTETAPTSVGDFFGPTAAAVDVVIPDDASESMIEAGLTAVDALARRYDDKTPVELTSSAPAAGVASQRVVSLVEGRAGEVTTDVAAAGGIPTLTLTGTGAALVDATRSLSSDALLLGGGQDQDPSTQMKARSTATTQALKDLDVSSLSLQGYGGVTQQVKIKQDDFGSPVDSLVLHLVGTHTAFAGDAGARLDVRANGALVGSAALGSGSTLDQTVTIPASRLSSVTDLDLTLSVPPPGGAACAAAGTSGAEVDIDVSNSTVKASRGTGRAEGFQLYPQVLEGTLPIAIGSTGKARIQSAIDAADLVVALQRAAASQFDISVISPDTFLADNRSGLIVGAVAQDSVNLDAPLVLSSTRRLDRADSRFAVTSQDPYAVLESIDRNNRFVLMLGSWAPGDGPASGRLTRKVADAVVAQEWATLSGDLVLADDSTPAFTAASRSLKPHTVVTTQRSYVKWFVAAILILLLLLALQVFNTVRRSRAKARADRAEEADERKRGPAYVEDPDHPDAAAADDLGDLDDLDVTSATSGSGARTTGSSPSGSGSGTAAAKKTTAPRKPGSPNRTGGRGSSTTKKSPSPRKPRGKR